MGYFDEDIFWAEGGDGGFLGGDFTVDTAVDGVFFSFEGGHGC